MNVITSHYQIRWLIRRDMDDVLRIELSNHHQPWDENQFLEHLRQRNCIGLVVENDDCEIVGFVIYELHPKRLHLLNFCVDPEHRKQGVATAIIDRLKYKLSQQRRNELWVEVPETNLPVQLFLRSQGFMAVDILDDCGREEAAYDMRYLIDSPDH